METIYIVVLLFVLLLAVILLRLWWLPTLTILFHGEGEQTVCERTNEIMDKFLSDRIPPEMALEMESLCNDIAYDTTVSKKILNAKPAERDAVTAKIILDTMLHFNIYTKTPCDISGNAIRENLKSLKLIGDSSCFNSSSLSKLQEIAAGVLVKTEKKIDISLRECFRGNKIRELNSTPPADDSGSSTLREELTKKNMELRTLNEEVDRLKRHGSTKISSISTELFLEECNRERKLLQERVYELRRDVEKFQNMSGGSGPEIKDLRARVDDLRNRNSQLESQLHNIQQSHQGESGKIAHLNAQLVDCQQMLDHVLTNHV